jgi:hypothetical protein
VGGRARSAVERSAAAMFGAVGWDRGRRTTHANDKPKRLYRLAKDGLTGFDEVLLLDARRVSAGDIEVHEFASADIIGLPTDGQTVQVGVRTRANRSVARAPAPWRSYDGYDRRCSFPRCRPN